MNILSILQELNIPTAPSSHHHRTPNFEQIDCPWCSPNSSRWRLGISTNGLTASCWTCGVHSVIDTLVEASGSNYVSVIQLLKSLGYNELEPKPKRAKGKLKLPDGLGPFLPIHRQYLRYRGFDPEQESKLWGLQGIGLAPKLGWRIFIPVHYQGRIVSWTTRAIDDEVPRRYINAEAGHEELPIKDLLYGADFVRHAIIVTEGPFDAIRIGPGAVATMGVVTTRPQIKKIAEYPIRVICFDNEKDAQDRAKGLCKILQPFEGKTTNVVLDAKDPGSAPKTEVDKIRSMFLD